MKEAAIRIAALLSYCGGPLYVGEVLKPHLNTPIAFMITFLPVGLMVMGSFFLEDDIRDRTSFAFVRAGRQALYVVLGMHAYALWCFANGVRISEQYLYYFGIVVGVGWSVVYLRASRRWKRPAGASFRPEDAPSSEPIEPS